MKRQKKEGSSEVRGTKRKRQTGRSSDSVQLRRSTRAKPWQDVADTVAKGHAMKRIKLPSFSRGKKRKGRVEEERAKDEDEGREEEDDGEAAESQTSTHGDESELVEGQKTNKGGRKEKKKEAKKEVTAKKKTKKLASEKKKKKKNKKATTAHTPVKGSQKATETLLKIWKEICKASPDKEGFSVAPVDDNMYKWHVRLFGWDEGSQIKEDMFLFESVTGKDHVLLEVLFPPNFPDDPPFLRVVYPRFHQYTGHITSGGSICIKDLTRSGWDPKFQLSSFFIMIRNLLLEGGALVDMDSAGVEYSEEEARAAFQRVAEAHGWKA